MEEPQPAIIILVCGLYWGRYPPSKLDNTKQCPMYIPAPISTKSGSKCATNRTPRTLPKSSPPRSHVNARSTPPRAIFSSHVVAVCSASRLAKEASSDISHICLLEFVVLAVHAVNANEVECLDHSVKVEAHIDETIDEVFVEALVSSLISTSLT